jgi:hypothetical protein
LRRRSEPPSLLSGSGENNKNGRPEIQSFPRGKS